MPYYPDLAAYEGVAVSRPSMLSGKLGRSMAEHEPRAPTNFHCKLASRIPESSNCDLHVSTWTSRDLLTEQLEALHEMAPQRAQHFEEDLMIRLERTAAPITPSGPPRASLNAAPPFPERAYRDMNPAPSSWHRGNWAVAAPILRYPTARDMAARSTNPEAPAPLRPAPAPVAWAPAPAPGPAQVPMLGSRGGGATCAVARQPIW